ncbi:hypothetical protein [uncultured Fibrobacter sp.]|uniref:hypothetical protein n=1 Tax=uncultured Fibrobacter sp. TaxID=261512 RepID=UPI0025E77327|nr:hypothetical protein [uncultured Fibrobacter sp.]
MKKALALFFALALSSQAFAAKAPTHHSIRAESMGNAHVAVVDDKEAIYFNYAGLSQINRLGNYEKRPEQGYYPRNYFDMRLNLGGAGPFESYFATYQDAKDLQKLYNRVNQAAEETGLSQTNLLLDTLSAHPELIHTLNSYDHKALSMKVKMDAELALHNLGGAIWVDGNVAPYIDAGLVLPYLTIDTFYVDAVMQGGIAYDFTNEFSFGIGIKGAKRQKVEMIVMDIANYETINDTLQDRFDDAEKHVFDTKTISIGMDFGTLWQATREVRLGLSLRDVYFKDLAGDKITPNLTMGVNYSPRFFNVNTAYARKFNIACDYADAFDSDRNYKIMHHFNLGLEIEQVLLAWPGLNNQLRVLSGRLAAGFKGGYPTAGAGVEILHVLTLEFATWAEERGYYTGQDEERIYMGQISLGF